MLQRRVAVGPYRIATRALGKDVTLLAAVFGFPLQTKADVWLTPDLVASTPRATKQLEGQALAPVLGSNILEASRLVDILHGADTWSDFGMSDESAYT